MKRKLAPCNDTFTRSLAESQQAKIRQKFNATYSDPRLRKPRKQTKREHERAIYDREIEKLAMNAAHIERELIKLRDDASFELECSNLSELDVVAENLRADFNALLRKYHVRDSAMLDDVLNA